MTDTNQSTGSQELNANTSTSKYDLARKGATLILAIAGIAAQLASISGAHTPNFISDLLNVGVDKLAAFLGILTAFIAPVHKIADDLKTMISSAFSSNKSTSDTAYDDLKKQHEELKKQFEGLAKLVQEKPPGNAQQLVSSTPMSMPPLQQNTAYTGGTIRSIAIVCLLCLFSSPFISGCASNQMSAQNSLLEACTVHAHTVRELAAVKTTLTQAQIKSVDEQIAIAEPICSGSMPDSSSDALRALAASLSSLESVKSGGTGAASGVSK